MIEHKQEKYRQQLYDFLSENATRDEATAVAVKRVIAWQIEQKMKAQNLSKTTLASASAVLGEEVECRVVGGLKINGTSLITPNGVTSIDCRAFYEAGVFETVILELSK